EFQSAVRGRQQSSRRSHRPKAAQDDALAEGEGTAENGDVRCLMQFGICTTLDQAGAAKAAGWDYLEESVQGLLQGEVSDDQWKAFELAKSSPLPIRCANML